jgi:hypothetical protein
MQQDMGEDVARTAGGVLPRHHAVPQGHAEGQPLPSQTPRPSLYLIRLAFQTRDCARHQRIGLSFGQVAYYLVHPPTAAMACLRGEGGIRQLGEPVIG